MMNREMMEEIFENVCRENDMAWYEVYDSEMMEEIVDARIMAVAGWTREDLENDPEYLAWTCEMGEDL